MRGGIVRVALVAAAAAFAVVFALRDGESEARPLDAAIDGSMALSVHPENPRYFADASGRLVYLTGSHTWTSLADRGSGWPPERFDFPAYLDVLERNGHNFIRLWTWELPRWVDDDGELRWTSPLPWRRTGPGKAADGRPRFDLTRFDREYFKRLRNRVRAARERGMYVSVMLFEGWGVQFAQAGTHWSTHPFNPANNVNGVNGDGDGDGKGDVHTLRSSRVNDLQRRYVLEVLDTVADFDNVLFEVANETDVHRSTEWQYWLIGVVRQGLAARGLDRPVGMTFQHRDWENPSLFASEANWVSPGDRRWLGDPEPADGRKVVLSDTDHHCGVCADGVFVWKSFLRGHNPIYMDRPFNDHPALVSARHAMGDTRRYAERIDLAASEPRPELSTTYYTLAVPGREYLVYQPLGGEFSVDLRASAGAFAVEWFDPTRRTTQRGSAVDAGAWRSFRPPFAGAAVLYLRR